jgi:hypothetical protein
MLITWCEIHFQVGLDRRPVMREAYALFKDGGDPEKVILFEVECIYLVCVLIDFCETDIALS